MIIKHPYSHLSFPELTHAILNGYDHHFRVHTDGILHCLSNPGKHYSLEEVHLQVVTCSLIKASLYLITTHDGMYKGTLIDYWEH
jgi:hypothetical protein